MKQHTGLASLIKRTRRLCGVLIAFTCVICTTHGQAAPHKDKDMMMLESPKRQAPKPVTSVEANNVRYEVSTAGKGAGVIMATDLTNGKTLWTKPVYAQSIDPNEEKDVQEIDITKLSLTEDKNALRIENQAHKVFLMNLETQEMQDITER